MDIELGDYLGAYATAGNIERESPSGTGLWYVSGDYIPCTNVTFTNWANNIISLYGTGTEAGAGWATIASVIGVGEANILTINGVAKANIAKINGVAV